MGLRVALCDGSHCRFEHRAHFSAAISPRAGHSYFQVPWAAPITPPLDYRLNSRLLIANICEQTNVVHPGREIAYTNTMCGAHYFVMTENGPKLVYRVLERP